MLNIFLLFLLDSGDAPVISTNIAHSGIQRKFSWGDFIQWHTVVICIWCALFLTLQFDVVSMLPNERFGEVC